MHNTINDCSELSTSWLASDDGAGDTDGKEALSSKPTRISGALDFFERLLALDFKYYQNTQLVNLQFKITFVWYTVCLSFAKNK